MRVLTGVPKAPIFKKIKNSMSRDIYEHRHTFEESGPFPDFAKALQDKYNNIPNHILQPSEPVIVVDAGLHEYLTSLNKNGTTDNNK